MIISFSAQNFKCIKEKVTLSFEPENSDTLQDYYFIEPMKGVKLLKLGLIYGPNGSGKTTILTSLNFLRNLVIHPLQQKQEVLDFKPFLFDDKTQDAASSFELSFIHNNTKYSYYLQFNRQAILSEKLYFHSPNKALVFQRTTNTLKQLTSIKFGGKIKIKKTAEETLEANTLWNTTVLSAFLKTNIELPELKNVTDWFIEVLKAVITPGASFKNYITRGLSEHKINKAYIIQFLKKADFAINDITIQTTKVNIKPNTLEMVALLNKQIESSHPDAPSLPLLEELEKKDLLFEHVIQKTDGTTASYRLPYEEESEGTQRYFQFSGLLDVMLHQESVFMLDELESSLHPDLIKHFMLLFLVNVKKTQLMATTHHRELLMERDILREDAIWFTEKKADGSIDLFSLSDFDSSVVRDTTSIYNAYKSGKLGAKPVLSDYYLNIPNGEIH
ncbi:AAA family ATPase [Chitinophaga nivalis]|uniref:AAA family ATPase n=1 Tax=Chitinophaga nivalis TaxID=2991709 RepID=A0ABT3IT41_9BACT|nr:AAA family ATPase [Chitinophaga nivalis]MCW3463168.1 AAA family ATPase [Chitinophaga nivalis]MCW3487142.1 AAA family ATPase [Chitinophaga nivalis]